MLKGPRMMRRDFLRFAVFEPNILLCHLHDTMSA
jgi:hypothetical protein